MNLRRQKLENRLTPWEKQKFFVERRKNNEKIAEDRILRKEENFNAGLHAEAERRRIKNPVEYESTNDFIQGIHQKRRTEENRRLLAQQKAAEERRQQEEAERRRHEPEPEHITPIRTTERTAERKPAKKKNRDFER